MYQMARSSGVRSLRRSWQGVSTWRPRLETTSAKRLKLNDRSIESCARNAIGDFSAHHWVWRQWTSSWMRAGRSAASETLLLACSWRPCLWCSGVTWLDSYNELTKNVGKTSVLHLPSVGDGTSVDPPLRRGSSQSIRGSCTIGLGCEGGNDWRVSEVGERELVLVVSVRCGKERDMTRGWQPLFRTPMRAILSREALEPRVFAWRNVIILCTVCADTPCAYMLYECVFCSHTPSVVGKFIYRFSSSNGYGPNLLTRTKATSLPATVYTTSSLFEDRLNSHTLQFPQTPVLFAVLLVGCE